MIPRFSGGEALTIARDHFGISAESARPLVAYSDQNFRLRCGQTGRDLVLKISNAAETEVGLDLQNQAMRHAARHLRSLAVARVESTVAGERMVAAQAGSGRSHLVRLLTFVPGRLLAEVEKPATSTLRALGRAMADLDRALAGFDHPAARRQASWDPRNGSMLRAYLRYLVDDRQRSLVEQFLDRFENDTAPLLKSLRQTVIHNDGNPHNILVDDSADGVCGIVGIIDFGDVVHSHTVCEVAVAAAYATLGAKSPVATAAAVVSGFHQSLPLTTDEIRGLLDLICVRLCASVTFAAFNKTRDPDNAYLEINVAPAWRVLETLARVPPQEVRQVFSEACRI